MIYLRRNFHLRGQQLKLYRSVTIAKRRAWRSQLGGGVVQLRAVDVVARRDCKRLAAEVLSVATQLRLIAVSLTCTSMAATRWGTLNTGSDRHWNSQTCVSAKPGSDGVDEDAPGMRLWILAAKRGSVN